MMIDNRYRPVIKPSRLLVLSRRLYSPLGEEESSHAPLDEPPEIKLNPEKFAMGLKRIINWSTAHVIVDLFVKS